MINREEGKLLYDTRKKKKNIYTKFPSLKSRPLRTHQLYTQDNNSTFSQLMIARYDALKAISAKRPVSTKPASGSGTSVKNPKHTAVLTECGIDYERPLLPTEVAARRTDRLREKQKLISSEARKPPTPTQPMQSTSQATSQASVAPSPSTSAQSSAAVVSVAQQVVTTSVAASQPGTPPGTVRTQRIVASPMTNTAVVSVAGKLRLVPKIINESTIPIFE